MDDTRFEFTGLVFVLVWGTCGACEAAGVLLTVTLNVTVGGRASVVGDFSTAAGTGGGLGTRLAMDSSAGDVATCDDFGVAFSRTGSRCVHIVDVVISVVLLTLSRAHCGILECFVVDFGAITALVAI